MHLFASFLVCLFAFVFFPISFENVARRELAQVHPRKFTCAGSSAWKYSVIVAARAHLRKVCVCGQIYGRCLGEIYWCNFGFICGRGFEPQQALYKLLSLPFIFVRRLLSFPFFCVAAKNLHFTLYNVQVCYWLLQPNVGRFFSYWASSCATPPGLQARPCMYVCMHVCSSYVCTRRFAPRAAYATRYPCLRRKNSVKRTKVHD